MPRMAYSKVPLSSPDRDVKRIVASSIRVAQHRQQDEDTRVKNNAQAVASALAKAFQKEKFDISFKGDTPVFHLQIYREMDNMPFFRDNWFAPIDTRKFLDLVETAFQQWMQENGLNPHANMRWDMDYVGLAHNVPDCLPGTRWLCCLGAKDKHIGDPYTISLILEGPALIPDRSVEKRATPGGVLSCGCCGVYMCGPYRQHGRTSNRHSRVCAAEPGQRG